MRDVDEFEYSDQEGDDELDPEVAELYEEATSLDDPNLMREAFLVDLDRDEIEDATTEDEDNADWYSLPDRGFEKARHEEIEADHFVAVQGSTAARRRPQHKLAGITWYYDSESYYAYVLLAANAGKIREDELARVRAALIVRGINPVLEGDSHRPASNGIQYQTYIRVKNVNGGKPDLTDVVRALHDSIEAPPRIQQQTGPQRKPNHEPAQMSHDLERLLLAAKQETLEAQNKLHESRQKNRFLQMMIRGQKRQLEADREDFIGRIKLLLQYLGQTKRDVAAERETLVVVAQERARIEQDRDAANSLLDESLASATQYEIAAEQTMALTEEQLREAKQRIEILAFENQQLEDRVFDAERLHHPRSEGGKGFPEGEFERVLALTIPSVSFLNGSLSVMQREVQDYANVLAALRELDKNGHISRQKAVGGCARWHEIHFSTGSASDGRLYFAAIDGQQRWKVLVAKKATQKQDIRYLARVSLKHPS